MFFTPPNKGARESCDFLVKRILSPSKKLSVKKFVGAGNQLALKH